MAVKKLTAAQWVQWKTLPDDELAGKLRALEKATEYISVPSALLDFGPTKSDEQPKDDFYGLLLLRKLLGEAAAGKEYALRFPRYDFACIWYLSQKGKSLDEIRSLFPLNEVAGFATTAVDAVTGNPFGAVLKAFMDFGMEGWSARLTLQFTKRGVDKATQERIRGLDLDRELIRELSGLFAEDLNAAMGSARSPERIVLFFDTHEAFYGRNRSFEDDFFLDEWLRRLLRRLDTALGIVVVVAGRDKPRWAEARKQTHIPTDYVQLESVDDLVASDAKIFLRRAGVTDAALQESLIRYASVETGRVHPLHLGLCADVVLEAAAKGVALVPGDFSERAEFRDKSVDLIKQLLFYADDGLRDAIRALSACRAFDFEIYQLLGEKLSFAVDKATFHRLVEFSFVRQVSQLGDKWFRVHDLLRRLGNETALSKAHKILEAHYQSLGEFEFIYHANQLDWRQGVNLWVKAFEEALKYCRFDLCRLLLDIRQELKIDDPSVGGITFTLEGDYLQTLALFDDAKESYSRAIAAHDQKLKNAPSCTSALNDKGNTLWALGDLQATMSETTKAQESYELAIDSYNKVLDIFHGSVQNTKGKATAFHNRGTAFQKLANLQTSIDRVSQAKRNYRLSIRSYDLALKIYPHDVELLNSKGVSLRRLGDLQAKIPDLQKAKESYELSVSSLNAILERTPYDVSALNNKGSSLMSLASLQKELSEYSQAKASYIESIKTYDTALERSSEHIGVLSNKGAVLFNIAELYAGLSENLQAIGSYKKAVEVYDTALKLAPDQVGILYNKGWSLMKLASLQDERSSDIQENLNAALFTFNHLLEISPNNESARQIKETLLSHAKAEDE